MAVNSKVLEGWGWWKTLLTNNKVVTSGAIISIVLHNLVVFQRIRSFKDKNKFKVTTSENKYSERDLAKHSDKFPAQEGKVGVNGQFFNQIKSLFKVLIPNGWLKGDKLVWILMLHTCFLVLRTYLSVVVARIDGRIVRDLVNKDRNKFARSIAYWFAVAVPATYTNSMIRYLQSKLTIGFRTRLVDYTHALYLDGHLAYYKILNLDRRVDGADQYITTDIARFSEALAGLYSSIGKPLLDLMIFNYQLSQSIGKSSIVAMWMVYMATVSILRSVSPQFGKLVAQQTQLEGEYRGAHTRLITNAEEIAFYNGGPIEESILTRAYTKMIKHVNSIYRVRINYNMLEDFVIKYCWSACGLGFCAIPVFKPEWLPANHRSKNEQGDHSSKKPASRTQDFITNKRLMLSLSDAGGRIMYSYKELAELAGYTQRVYSLISTLHSLRASQYQSVATAEQDQLADELFTLDRIQGQLVIGEEGVKFEHVPIVTPNPGNPAGGDLLVKDLNIEILPGQHLLITGPNGVGKTAVSRVLRGLWPVFRGTLSRPDISDMFFVPQKPYLSLGNLRDQIIYPHNLDQMNHAGVTDADLIKILKEVHLEHIPEREGGFDTVKEWKDVFSGGEKQRLGMARLFYHKPNFAVLDECTSAVSSDVEGLMYSHAKQLKITLITISHRPSLMKYHHHLLKLVGGEDGAYEVSNIGSDKQRHTTVAKEIDEIRNLLKDKQEWEIRLKDVNQQLKS